jgi:hypothetical protein
MLRQGDPHRQMAAAWVMGQTGDSRFLPCLEQVLPASTGRTRSNLMRAIRSIEARQRRLAELPRLALEMVRVEWGRQGRVQFGFTCSLREEVLATQVLVHDGGLRVDAVRVEPRGAGEAAQAILIVPAGREGQWLRWVEELRRRQDEWAIYSYEDVADALEGLRRAVRSFGRESRQRHVVLALEAGADAGSRAGLGQERSQLESWRMEAAAGGVQFHVLAAGETAIADRELWQRMSWSLRGFLVGCGGGDPGRKDGFTRLLRGMAGSYDLTYELARLSPLAEGERPSIRLEIITDEGCGCLEWEPEAGGRLD